MGIAVYDSLDTVHPTTITFASMALVPGLFRSVFNQVCASSSFQSADSLTQSSVWCAGMSSEDSPTSNTGGGPVLKLFLPLFSSLNCLCICKYYWS